METLLEEIQPVWHFRSRHSRVVKAPAATVFNAWESARLDRDATPLVRLLFRARGLSVPTGPTPRQALGSIGFSVLAERPGREVVFGIAGKFWAPREMAHLLRVPDAAAFAAFERPGEAKGAMSLLAHPLTADLTLLRTETRVTCTDPRARLLFGAYWTLIRIPSGLIRHEMLRTIARRAEQPEPAHDAGALA